MNFKFKIRDTKNNKWVSLANCYWKAKDLFPENSEIPYEGIVIVPCSFVKAKKEYEIDQTKVILDVDLYVGDIVSFEENFYTIEFLKGSFCIKNTKTETVHPIFNLKHFSSGASIVGNIYDNSLEDFNKN